MAGTRSPRADIIAPVKKPKPPATPKPVKGAKLTWRCREVVDRAAIWILAIGVCAIVAIVVVAILWALGIGSRVWKEAEIGLAIGLVVAIGFVVRGLIGDWDLRLLPRVDHKTGILFFGERRYPDVWRLADLGDITVEETVVPIDGRIAAHGVRVTGFVVQSSTAGEIAEFGRLFRSDADRLATALRALVAARTLPPTT
jgi:hypothetical protein